MGEYSFGQTALQPHMANLGANWGTPSSGPTTANFGIPSYTPSNAYTSSGSLSNLLTTSGNNANNFSIDSMGFKGMNNAAPETTFGMTGQDIGLGLGAINIGTGIAGLVAQFGSLDVAKKNLAFQKNSFNKNYDAQKQTANNRIVDQRVSRNAAMGEAAAMAAYGDVNKKLIV